MSPPTTAERMRLCRERKRVGLLVKLVVKDEDLAALVASGILRRGAMYDRDEVAKAVAAVLRMNWSEK